MCLLTIDSRNLMQPGGVVPTQLVAPTPFLQSKFQHLSAHGNAYTISALLQPIGNNITLVNYQPILELVLELVRAASFPNLPSRLVSMFACDNMSVLQQFSATYNKHGNVFEITGQSSGPYDMRHLMLGFTIAQAWEYAENYWSGNQTTQPLPEYLVALPSTVGSQVGVL